MAITDIADISGPGQVPVPVPNTNPAQFGAPPEAAPAQVQIKIFTAIPTTAWVHMSWVSIFHQMMASMPAGSSFAPISQYGVAESRERLVDIFMAMPDMTHILFWDTDITPPITVDGKPVWQVMLEDGQPIVAGMYVNSLRKGINGWLKTGELPDKSPIHTPINLALNPQLQELFQVALLGFGFVLIARHVFQQLIDKKVPRPWFKYIINEPNEYGKNEMMSEDFYFCDKIITPHLGIKPVIDQRIKVVHWRYIGFNPDGSLV